MDTRLTELTRENIPAICRLEQDCWPPALQAGASTIEHRLASGHTLVGAWSDDRLAGLIAYRHVKFNPLDPNAFPKTFAEFASGNRQPEFNAVYGYNMSVHPALRGSQIIHDLLAGAIARVRADGCRYIVGDGRCPSYNGEGEDGNDKTISQSPVFRAAMDRFMNGGAFPSLQEFLADPALRFFYRKMQCRFLWILPDFFPGDHASGGYRVIYCVDLHDGLL